MQKSSGQAGTVVMPHVLTLALFQRLQGIDCPDPQARKPPSPSPRDKFRVQDLDFEDSDYC